MVRKTLQWIQSDLARPEEQLAVLGDPARVPAGRFAGQLESIGAGPLRRDCLQIVQINVGRVCNQTCTHCHVDAGPDRKESMTRETAEAILEFLARSTASTLDITGGAPEMNPNFRFLVQQARAMGRNVIDRCNLTILLAPRYESLADFLAAHQVAVVASLPCYLEENCDAQRGTGVFAKSIEALKRLNNLGYGREGSGLELHLVYNPVGLGLPPDQQRLEHDYKQQLADRFGIVFNRLFTITNMPISRFLEDLLAQGQYETYMQKLIDHFNPATLDNLMCRSMISVDWQGFVYDCDFNQMLDLPIPAGGRPHISELTESALVGLPIATANHCFGCTSGCGSSCQGSLT
ncbi:MAG: radical SAM/Cys-rich domain protein [Planctomycetota bacterium]|nr:MAG: radical SAM/Cys-rich domain protein [Planctomycetota bacterium]